MLTTDSPILGGPPPRVGTGVASRHARFASVERSAQSGPQSRSSRHGGSLGVGVSSGRGVVGGGATVTVQAARTPRRNALRTAVSQAGSGKSEDTVSRAFVVGSGSSPANQPKKRASWAFCSGER